ncbi:coat protein [Listeria grandensis]|uniref:Coat protein n=1 Tax=Listeria grandensis TaxID=1494963 RepID=A0A7X0Y533_9LIST|nr:coat protein [Listeria grandensis]MBC1937182.1 coat protein [Listeria grandensis]
MAITTLADMKFIPDKFNKYVLQRTTEKSALVRSGIITTSPEYSELINGSGGQFITMPFFQPLAGEDDVFTEDDIETGNIQSGKGTAPVLMRVKGWAETDLSKALSGEDPLGATAEQISDWWVGREQQILLSILKGILDPSTGTLKAHVNDISTGIGSAANISVGATLDTKQTMGDAAQSLGLIAMHSAVYTYLQKMQQIEFVTDAETNITIARYLNYDILVDDGILPVNGAYTTYLLGSGAFGRADGTPKGFVPSEIERSAKGSKTSLYNRRAMILQPQGISWEKLGGYSNPKHTTPANIDLATSSNWKAIVDHKNIPITAIKHKIDVPAGA